VQAECTLINFMVTEDGLEDQLLAKVGPPTLIAVERILHKEDSQGQILALVFR
jgi:hypothetical protein